jgi:hypothetical protein
MARPLRSGNAFERAEVAERALGRATRRWTLVAMAWQSATGTLLSAGLPARSARVSVGPPWSASPDRLGAATV